MGEDPITNKVKQDYRATFDTDVGRRVLAHMLTELHFFDEVTSEEETALSNYAHRILYHLGVLHGNSIPELVTQLLTVNRLGREE